MTKGKTMHCARCDGDGFVSSWSDRIRCVACGGLGVQCFHCGAELHERGDSLECTHGGELALNGTETTHG